MLHLIISAILSACGWLWLILRHPVKADRDRALAEKYKGSYVNAGKPFFIAFIILVFVMELLVECLPARYR